MNENKAQALREEYNKLHRAVLAEYRKSAPDKNKIARWQQREVAIRRELRTIIWKVNAPHRL